MNLYTITEFNDEQPIVLITLYCLRSLYFYLGKASFPNPDNRTKSQDKSVDYNLLNIEHNNPPVGGVPLFADTQRVELYIFRLENIQRSRLKARASRHHGETIKASP